MRRRCSPCRTPPLLRALTAAVVRLPPPAVAPQAAANIAWAFAALAAAGAAPLRRADMFAVLSLLLANRSRLEPPHLRQAHPPPPLVLSGHAASLTPY